MKVESLVLKIECDTLLIRDELTKIADEFEQRIKVILAEAKIGPGDDVEEK